MIRILFAVALCCAVSPAFADVSMSGVNHQLQAKVHSIKAACPGTVVISAVRNTRVRGRGHWSLHKYGQAVDVRGPYGCIYRELEGWPGGYSTDAERMKHIHVSIGGREAGLRFRHGGGRKYARRHKHRYAGAGQ